MSPAPPSMRNFAQRILAHEARETRSSAKEPSAAFHVFTTLRPHLATLMGNAGSRALFSHAVALAHVEAPWLGAVQVTADGSLRAPDEPGAALDPRVQTESEEILLAQLLGLL